jgi:hypothetical protein
VIGRGSFSECRRLLFLEFEMNSKLKLICPEAFSFTRLNRLIIPEGVETLAAYSFSNCGFLAFLKLEGRTNIEKLAFFNSPVMRVVIPNGMKLDYDFGCDCRIDSGDIDVNLLRFPARVQPEASMYNWIISLERYVHPVEIRNGPQGVITTMINRDTGEMVAVKTYPNILATREQADRVQEIFSREGVNLAEDLNK